MGSGIPLNQVSVLPPIQFFSHVDENTLQVCELAVDAIHASVQIAGAEGGEPGVNLSSVAE